MTAAANSRRLAPRWQADRALRGARLGPTATAVGYAILSFMQPDGTVPAYSAKRYTVAGICHRAGGISRRSYFRALLRLEQAGIFRRESAPIWRPRDRRCYRRTIVHLAKRFDLRKCQPGSPTPQESDPRSPLPSVVTPTDPYRRHRDGLLNDWNKLAKARSDVPALRPAAVPFSALCGHCGLPGHHATACPN